MPHCHTLIAELRRQGYRITPQREMIVQAIAHAGCHLTAEDVYEQVQARTRAINLATVYRTLELLAGLGLVSRCDLGSGKVCYATLRHGPHGHLVCRQCGRVLDADYRLIEPLAEQLREQYGFEADLNHLAISGLCADCHS